MSMKVEYQGERYRIRYHYLTHNSTSCTIQVSREEGKRWISIGYGSAICSKRDRFSKPIGRKLALTRALQGFDRDFRAALWQAYFRGVKEAHR